ncbi:MAG: hypothetical protein KUL77_06610 [Thermomonas sp.]|uniref:glycosyl hydrolase family 18 protein n=1 Tax=Thermomonas sp. TaxID=1971895 RepID=UPI001EB7247C|nr:glycosyl hydrolase family 18 protein [Thermomonas sp.]MBV2209218.1 hypothetical protein [Thermomonas sp.]
MRISLLAASLFIASLACSAVASDTPHAPQVMGWVPAYGVEASMEALNANPKIGQALTRIGLQFWNPSADGRSLVLAPAGKDGSALSPDAIARVRDWAHARGIKVLLTVYNNSETTLVWDWPLALRAFRDNRDAFADAMVQEMQRHQLDGIDLDFEGNGDFSADRAAFADFVRTLSAKLRPSGKLLTIDSFHSPCYNAPNMAWWEDWKEHVDSIHSMGYQDLYEASTTTFTPEGGSICAKGAALFKYSWQLGWGQKHGYRVDQIILGQPTWADRWGDAGKETDAASHIEEAHKLGAGVALWDLQLPAPGWRSDATWDAMLKLRGKQATQ